MTAMVALSIMSLVWYLLPIVLIVGGFYLVARSMLRPRKFISVTVDHDLAGYAIRWDSEKVTIEITNPEVLEQWMQLERPTLTVSARHLPRYHAGERMRGRDGETEGFE
jgi:hypothetical protein